MSALPKCKAASDDRSCYVMQTSPEHVEDRAVRSLKVVEIRILTDQD